MEGRDGLSAPRRDGNPTRAMDLGRSFAYALARQALLFPQAIIDSQQEPKSLSIVVSKSGVATGATELETISPATSTSQTVESSSRVARRIALIAPILLIVVLFFGVGRWGYSPTDDGNILAQTGRILHGQIPHKDVIFARPMGSALLHVLDYGIPMPRFEASRLLGIGEFVLYSIAFAWLIYGIPPIRWRLFHIAGALVALLVNMHVFPLMGWYTTDGLVFVALGFLSLERGLSRTSRRLTLVGMAMLGLAPLMKQSFAVAPLLGAFRVLTITESGNRLRRTVPAIVAAMVPGVLYATTVAALGGFPQMISQIGRAQAVWGREFVNIFKDSELLLKVVFLAILVAATCLITRAARSASDSSDRTRLSTIALILRAFSSGVLIAIPLAAGLTFPAPWALLLTWTLVVYLIVDGVLERRLDVVGCWVAAAAWMTSLSWGYPLPDLVGGTVLLFLLDRMWSKAPHPGREFHSRLVTATLVATLIVGVVFVQARYRYPYYDRPRAQLTSSINSVSSEFGHIHTNPITARYLREIKSCVLRHPAERVAFLPDNPGIYPALGLTNPFPIDWMYPNEVQTESKRILATAVSLDRSGSYLIMFQTVSAFSLPDLHELPSASLNSRLFFYGTGLGTEIAARLHGQQVTCGPFLGLYRPRMAIQSVR